MRRLLLIGLIIVPAIIWGGTVWSAKDDSRTKLTAKQCLAPLSLDSAYYTISPQVQISGIAQKGQRFFNFRVKTPFGEWPVESKALLALRLHEAFILSRSEELRGEGQILNGVGSSLAQMGTNLVNAVKDPIGTVKAIPRWFGKMYARIRGVLKYEKQDKYKQQDGVVEGALIGGWKRKLAYELQIDCYTTNPPMMELLYQMASYQAAGGNLVRVASWFVGGPVSLALQAQRFAGWRKQLRDFSAGDLARFNNKRLLSWGLTQEEADAFQDNPILSPVHKTITLNAVDLLGKVPGRLKLIEAGKAAKTEAQAILMTRTAVHILGYHQKMSPVKSIRLISGLPLIRDAKNRAVVPYLSDYLDWSQESTAIFDKIGREAGSGKKILLHDSKLTSRASRNLQRLGFKFLKAQKTVPDQAAEMAVAFYATTLKDPPPPKTKAEIAAAAQNLVHPEDDPNTR